MPNQLKVSCIGAKLHVMITPVYRRTGLDLDPTYKHSRTKYVDLVGQWIS